MNPLVVDHPARRRRLRLVPIRLLHRVRSRLARALPGTALGGLIRQTAREAWPLLAAMLLSSLLLALCEGLTFTVIFQAARLLSGGGAAEGMALPGAPGLPLAGLSALPAGQRFALLLGIAVLLQGLTSLFNYINGVSAGWFAARCQREVTPTLHRHLLSLSYACASRYPVGDLVSRCTQAPVAVQQIGRAHV